MSISGLRELLLQPGRDDRCLQWKCEIGQKGTISALMLNPGDLWRCGRERSLRLFKIGSKHAQTVSTKPPNIKNRPPGTGTLRAQFGFCVPDSDIVNKFSMLCSISADFVRQELGRGYREAPLRAQRAPPDHFLIDTESHVLVECLRFKPTGFARYWRMIHWRARFWR